MLSFFPRFSSSVSLGSRFEHFSLSFLREFAGLSLAHSGGPGDGGADFRGNWTIRGKTVEIIGQCKFERKNTQPEALRALEGSLAQGSPGSLGILVSARPFSPPCEAHWRKSSFPLALVHLQMKQTRESGMIKEKVSLSPVEESSADHPIPPPPPLPAAWALLDDFQRQRLVVSSLGASSLSPLLASLPPAELSFYRGRALRSLGRSYYGAALAEFRQCRRSWRFAEAQQEISSLDNSSIEFLAGAPDGDVCPLVRFSLNPAASRLLPTVRVVREAVESAGRLRFKLKMIENNNDK